MDSRQHLYSLSVIVAEIWTEPSFFSSVMPTSRFFKLCCKNGERKKTDNGLRAASNTESAPDWERDALIVANYLIVCAGPDHSAETERWLTNAAGAPTDVHRIAAVSQCMCYYVAHCGKQDATTDAGIFKGYAIDHDKRRIIFSGGDVSPAVHWPMPGCYIRLQQELGDIVVGNDFFAQLPMLYFAEKGVVAVSDSVFMLTELRKRLGYPNRVHEDAALSRAWIHGMASQVLGLNTLIDSIQYCPPGTRIRVNLTGEQPVSKIERALAREYFSADITDYRDTIRTGAQRAASIVATFSQLDDASLVLSLSGGLDSRVCLAIMLAHGERDNFYITTNSSNKEDYAVAKMLAEHFCFKFETLHGSLQAKRRRSPDGFFLAQAFTILSLQGERLM